MKRFMVPAWVFLPFWIGLRLPSIAMGSQDGVAYAVYVGSFAAGAIIWKTPYTGADEKLAAFKRESFQASHAC